MTSDRTAMRLARLLAMLPWVIGNEGATIDEVRERFGYADRPDVIRDLELVFLCGLPGYGPGELMDATVLGDEVIVEDADYFSQPLRLTAAEALMLLAAGSAVLGSSAAPPALSSAMAKLQHVVAPDSDGGLAVDIGSEPQYAAQLRAAAAEGRVVNIEYTAISTGETTERDVEPWAVFSSLGNWYLTAHCRMAEGERIFRLDRIRGAEETGETFEPPTDQGAPQAAYSPSADDVHAVIDLAPQAAWVAEYYPVDVLDDSGPTRIDFAAGSPIVAARLLLRLGADATLVEGDEAGDALDGLRDRILARYG